MFSVPERAPADSEAVARPPCLELKGLHAWYGESHILHGVDLFLAPGELVTLLGKNGAGKSTTLRSIMGIGPRTEGSMRLFGPEVLGRRPETIARMGIAYCPEERAIFASLTVQENLLLPPVIAPGGLSLDEIFELFPNLKSRLRTQGTKLSGGEQQMLAIARILRTGAKVLLLDEPTEGLAPVIVEQIEATIAVLKKRGYTILLVEQNLNFAMSVADRFYLMEHGQIMSTVDRRDAAGQRDKLLEWLAL